MRISDIKNHVSLFGVVSRALGESPSRARSVTYFHCPFHNDTGRPNLCVWENTGRFKCFACGVDGDVVDFVSRLNKVSLKEAAALLLSGSSKFPEREKNVIPSKKEVSEQWLDYANRFVNYSIRNRQDSVLFWRLVFERGLSRDTVVSKKLGYNPLLHKATIDQEIVYFPPGIVIPLFSQEKLYGVKVRRTIGLDKYMKYHAIKGGTTGLYNSLPTPRVNVLTIHEGEFEALRVHQTQLVDAVSLNSAGARISDKFMELIARYKRVFVVMDNDDAGIRNSSRIVDELSSGGIRSKAVFVPGAKDVCDYHRIGENVFQLVLDWIKE